jgi:hypothetical protein
MLIRKKYILKCLLHFKIKDPNKGWSTVVEELNHDPRFVGSYPVSATTGREKKWKKDILNEFLL